MNQVARASEGLPWWVGVVAAVILVAVVLVLLWQRWIKSTHARSDAELPRRQETGIVRSVEKQDPISPDTQLFLIQVQKDKDGEIVPFRWAFLNEQAKPNGFPNLDDRVVIIYVYRFHDTHEQWVPDAFHLIGEGEQEHAGE
ncbi:MAG: hypothetical protein AAB431_02875 [Patescibacteria group bacterium]